MVSRGKQEHSLCVSSVSGVECFAQGVMVRPVFSGRNLRGRRSLNATNGIKSRLLSVSETYGARSKEYEALFLVWGFVYPLVIKEPPKPGVRIGSIRSSYEETMRGKVGKKITARFLRRSNYYAKVDEKSQMSKNVQ